MKPLAVYDWKTGKRLAFLENAYKIGYTQQTNGVWSGTFTLPYSDWKNKYCSPFNLVEIWDKNPRPDSYILPDIEATRSLETISGSISAGMPIGGLLLSLTHSGYSILPGSETFSIPAPQVTNEDRYIGLFRIMPITESNVLNNPRETTYTLEHVLTTLLDSSIVEYTLLGGIANENTAESIRAVLDYQETKQWVLMDCDYERKFLYEFEGQNLLSTLFHIVSRLSDNYYFSFHTRIFPWGLNLKKVSVSNPVTDIRYGKNIFGIKKKIDPRSLLTKLYIFGKEIDGTRVSMRNADGVEVEYLESETGIENYGVITKVIFDDRFSSGEALYEYGTALINKLDKPLVSYEVDIQTVYNAASLEIGDVVRIVTDDGLNKNLVVQQITKDDLTGSPHSGKIIIGQGTVDMGFITKSFI